MTRQRRRAVNIDHTDNVDVEELDQRDEVSNEIDQTVDHDGDVTTNGLRSDEDAENQESNELLENYLHRFIEFIISFISSVFNFLRCCFLCFVLCCVVCFFLCRVVFFLYYHGHELGDRIQRLVPQLIVQASSVGNEEGRDTDDPIDRIYRLVRQVMGSPNSVENESGRDTNDSYDRVHRLGPQLVELHTSSVGDEEDREFGRDGNESESESQGFVGDEGD